MIKYTISGEVKLDQNTHCSYCNDGLVFKEYFDVINTNSAGSKSSELICGECLTKYIIPKKESVLVYDIPLSFNIFQKDVDEFKDEVLTIDNLPLLALKIEQNKGKQVIKSNNEAFFISIDEEGNARLKINNSIYQNTISNLLGKILDKQEKDREMAYRLTPVQVGRMDLKFDLITGAS